MWSVCGGPPGTSVPTWGATHPDTSCHRHPACAPSPHVCANPAHQGHARDTRSHPRAVSAPQGLRGSLLPPHWVSPAWPQLCPSGELWFLCSVPADALKALGEHNHTGPARSKGLDCPCPVWVDEGVTTVGTLGVTPHACPAQPPTSSSDTFKTEDWECPLMAPGATHQRTP